MLKLDDVLLRPAVRDEKNFLWKAIYIDQEWKAFDAPFIPLEQQSKFKFSRHLFKRLLEGSTSLVIDYRGTAVGYITRYYEDHDINWLEIGITIFYQHDWNKQIGRKALHIWINYLFDVTKTSRIGLSTWSGNPMMMRCATSLGMRLEGRIRNVRYYNGKYYDSLHYGILRNEWEKATSPQIANAL